MKPSAPCCDLCSLPLRKQVFTLPSSEHTYSFCCNGCKQVFQMLAEKQGTDHPVSFKDSELFKKCQELGIIPQTEEDLHQKQDLPPAEQDDAPSPTTEGHLQLILRVNGMWCPACAWVIEESLRKQTGISSVHCSFSSDRMRCVYDPVSTSPARIRDSLASLGYEASPLEGSDQAENVAVAASEQDVIEVLGLEDGVDGQLEVQPKGKFWGVLDYVAGLTVPAAGKHTALAWKFTLAVQNSDDRYMER